MISDPVRGLARRHGSIMQDEVIIADYDPEDYAERLADSEQHRVVSFYVDGIEYDLICRTAAGVGKENFAWAFNKEARQFIPIVYATPDTVLDTLVSGGVSASANVGKYLYLAGNDIIPAWVPDDVYGAATNVKRIAAWVRGGAYARTFKVTLIRADGTRITGEYKTVSASYPGTLDTSDLLTTDPDYQKKVNDRVHAYNTAVTQWIGTSTTDITPENIAQKLADDLIAKGASGVSRVNGTVVIEDAQFIEGAGDDSGDDTLLRVVGNEVTAAELVSTVHYAGKIIKVRPKHSNGDDAFYLQAYPKDGLSTGWTEVTWREGAGYVMQPTELFIMGTVVSGTLYLASSATKLAAIAGGAHPEFKANEVGDDITCPLPAFFGKRIDYLGVFQDRLMVGSGAVLSASRSGGEYFNWFRQSVLTVIDTDPVEIYALGSEDDTIKASTTYDRNLLLFGGRKQYTISGRVPFTPKSASIVVLSAHEDAVDAEPKNSGNFVFYCKKRGRSSKRITTAHQVQIGQLADSPESFEISQQLDTYLRGNPLQIVALTSPNTVIVRTDDDRHTLYTYAYLDNASGAERLFDSWSKWVWDPKVGSIVGLSAHNSDVVVYMLRHGLDVNGVAKVWIAAELFVLDTPTSDYPYLDSLRPMADVLAGATDAFVNVESDLADEACVAFENASEYRFIGAGIADLAEIADAYPDNLSEVWAGVSYPAYTTPTNPYITDRNGKAVVAGRFTLGRVSVSVADTGGMDVSVTTASGTTTPVKFTGRLLGAAANLIGRQPIVTTSVTAPVGKEVRECQYTLTARRWLPLTITAIEWVGQVFNNAKRVQ